MRILPTSSSSNASTPFPTLDLCDREPWHWPRPPFIWRHGAAPAHNAPQPCTVESTAGSTVHGEMLNFDVEAKMLTLRTNPNGPSVGLPFTSFRRLTLTMPLLPASRIADAPVERIPAAAQEREYRLQSNRPGPALTGSSAGHVESAEGMYLFTPVDDEASVQRVFVPRSAYTRCEFGESAEEIAARRWIASPRELLDALERQQRMRVLPVGQALLALGLLTQRQLDRALANQSNERPLGESLVAAGVITRADLQTALAHKMGYPLVDLSRFPIDPEALVKLPKALAIGHRAMPLLVDGPRLIVAVDKPARVIKLRALRAYAELEIVAALTPRLHLIHAMDQLSQDVWSRHVAQRGAFFATTV